MEINENARVYSAHDEHVGKIDRIVVDPVAREVSHIVVRSGIFFPDEKIIPLTDIATATEERINLRSDADLAQYPSFDEQHFVPLVDAVTTSDAARLPAATPVIPPFAWYGPHGVASPLYDSFMATVTSRNIPERAGAVKPGSLVHTAEGAEAGSLERVIMADNGRATHIVINRPGLPPADRAVPITFVDDVSEGEVKLSVNNSLIDALPPFEPGTAPSPPKPLTHTDDNAAAVEIGGYRVQMVLTDLVALTLQVQHIRWNLTKEDDDLRAQFEDFDALARAGSDTLAARLRELGVSPDGRVNTAYHDLLFEPLPAEPFTGTDAVRAFSRRLAQLAVRLREGIEILEPTDPESHETLRVLSDEVVHWTNTFDPAAGGPSS